ncbi:hypothetical protein DRO19_00485 [Candidatus Bathyarchaeota archaeon]|nr:MAG: hypothetical protein DRO19_00485 [Candidatus Bathyarchaeota archaeon]
MKRLVLPLVLLLFLAVLPKPSFSYIIPHIYTLDLPLYAPARITINYAYTNNVSVRDISTLGQSMYKYSGGPTQVEFLAEDIDTYSFTVEIWYTKPVNQTVTVGVWSGTAQPMQGLAYESHFEHLIFHVTLRVTEEPHFPTEQEVAKATVAQIADELSQYYNQSRQLTESISQITITVSILALVSAIISIVSLLVVGVLYRSLKRSVQT